MRKRSRYKPKPTTIPMVWRFNANTERDFQLIPHDSLENFRHGRAEEADWHCLAARLNIGFVLARDHFAHESAEDVFARIHTAMEGLKAIQTRAEQKGKWGCTGEEFFAIGEALNLTDEMQLQCTRREINKAMAETFQVAQ